MVEDSVKEKLKHEITGILLIAVAVFLFLSLVSYHPMGSQSSVRVVVSMSSALSPTAAPA